MSRLDNNIALRKTIGDYCAARDQALTAYADALRILDSGAQALAQIGDYLWPHDAHPRTSLAEFTRELDARMWRQAWNKTDLPKFMDAQARKEFDDSLKNNPPAFTEDSVRSAMVSVASQADEMFARGLFEMFRTRDMDYQTNARETVKIPRRLIWSGAYVDTSAGGSLRFSYSHWHSDRLGDLDRVFKTLAGLPFNPRELESALNNVWKDGGNLYEDPFYRIRGYRNGNLHIELRQQPLIDRANRILAAYAGPSLPQSAAA